MTSPKSLMDRLVEYVELQPNGCWQWTGALNRRGYGTMVVPGASTTRAHRVVYEDMRGAISAGLTLDHLCGNKACVHPQHLEPVTAEENTARYRKAHRHGLGVRCAGCRHKTDDQTTCVRGHTFNPENTYVDTKGWKQCRACKRDWLRQYRARRAA